MKKIVLFASVILLSLVLFGCANPSGGDITEPATTTVTTVSSDGETTITNPVTGDGLPQLKKVALPKLYQPTNSTASISSRNVVIPFDQCNMAVWTGTGPVLIADWYATANASDGATFTKTLYGHEITFTITFDEEAKVITYTGVFDSDPDGQIIITYYDETKTFDLYYRVINTYPNCGAGILPGCESGDRNAYQAFLGKMYGAQIDENGGYIGKYQMYSYCSQLAVGAFADTAQIFSYRFDITATETAITVQSTARIVENRTSTYAFPDLCVPITYDSSFWSQMEDVDNRPNMTYEEMRSDSAWEHKWNVFAITGGTGENYTYQLPPRPVAPEVIEVEEPPVVEEPVVEPTEPEVPVETPTEDPISE